MFDRALKSQRKEELKLLKEYKKALKENYDGHDIGPVNPKIVRHNDVDYLVEPAWIRVVDAYDEDMDIETLTHKQGLGFSVINSYSNN